MILRLMPRSHPHTSLASQPYFPSFPVGGKKNTAWLMRLPSHKEDGLVNQVNPLGVVHN